MQLNNNVQMQLSFFKCLLHICCLLEILCNAQGRSIETENSDIENIHHGAEGVTLRPGGLSEFIRVVRAMPTQPAGRAARKTFSNRCALTTMAPRPTSPRKPKSPKPPSPPKPPKPPKPSMPPRSPRIKAPPAPWRPGKKEENAVIKYLESVDREVSILQHEVQLFSYADTIGEEYKPEDKENAEEASRNFNTQVQTTINAKFSWWKDLKNAVLRSEISRWFTEESNLSEEDQKKFEKLGEELEDSFGSVAVCRYKSAKCDCDSEDRKECVLKLEPDIEDILVSSRDPEELKYYWMAWHNEISKKVDPSLYEKYIQFANKNAQASGFKNNAHEWASQYDTLAPSWTTEGFRKEILRLWDQVKPYYKILHAYIRMKLSHYPPYKGLIKRCGLVPLHLLNNVFGQSWVNLENFTKPFPKTPSVDATGELKKQGYTVRKMVETAEDAFVGMSMLPLPSIFYEKSVFERMGDKPKDCHAMAHDLQLGKWGKEVDARISMCALVNQESLQTIHHELGHVQYMLQSAKLRYNLRGSPNPAFDESIGDVIGMSVSTPEHLQCVLGLNLGVQGICDKNKANYSVTETDINFLYLQALFTFPIFPFALSLDLYRYMIMEGEVKLHDYNKKWWALRRELQGVKPPEPRPDTAFDAASKYHLIAHSSYFRYFLSSVVQYQLYEGLCITAGHYNPKNKAGKPLYRCDFTGCPISGIQFGRMLSLGRTRPWPDLLKTVTRKERNFNTQPIIHYFQPLFDKLKQLLKEGGESDCLKKDWEAAEGGH